MTDYVVGLAYDITGEIATLIKKKRPVWQEGLLNGVGGHIEEGEEPYDAMVREFEEETDLFVDDWYHFMTLEIPNGHIFFYRVYLDLNDLTNIKSPTDEQVGLYHVNMLERHGLVPNLDWIVRLGRYDKDEYEPIFIKASKDTA